MKRLALLTSGGDAPGMNACIRAIVRIACAKGIVPVGVYRGYQGLIDNEMQELSARSVSNIIQRGGTILLTSRCSEFMTEEGRMIAKKNLEARQIDGLIAIGGDGTLSGAIELGKIWPKSIIGAPGTIDNDLYGSDYTIGCDTAVNTALEAIDKIRDTADAHERTFLIEVMGRNCGFNSLQVAISGGAEDVLLPETESNLEQVAKKLADNRMRGKKSSIIIVAEGDDKGGVNQIIEQLKTISDIDCRAVVLGHMQRGGSPTAMDRVLATELGAFAVDRFIAGDSCVMVGKVNNKLVTTPLHDTIHQKKTLDSYQMNLVPLLAT